ncbi:MAG: hypothetical protein ACE5FF_13535 [Saprospiraceae bacterium]
MIHNSKIETGEPFFSYHVFLFPFKWEHKKKANQPLEEQTNLNDFTAWLKLPDSKWTTKNT